MVTVSEGLSIRKYSPPIGQLIEDLALVGWKCRRQPGVTSGQSRVGARHALCQCRRLPLTVTATVQCSVNISLSYLDILSFTPITCYQSRVCPACYLSDQRVRSETMDQTVMSRTLLAVCLSILLTLPSTSSLNSFTLTTSLTTLSVLTPSAMSSSANFCPVEGTDYMTEGNMIKVTKKDPSVRAFSSDILILILSSCYQR